MFLGSVPPQMRSIVRETVASWPGDDLYVACCGNFTLERAVFGLGRRVHSEDVSIYTTAVGRWLTGQDTGIALAGESAGELGWLAGSLGCPIDVVATLMLGSNFLASVAKDGPYFRRLVRGYREQWPELHAATVAKLERVAEALKIESYTCMDVRQWLDQIPPGVPLVTFPPFDEAGYSVMWAALDRHFTWDPPAFDELSDADVDALFDTIRDRPLWLFGAKHEIPELAGYKRGAVQPTNRSRTIHVYASQGPTRIALPRQDIEPVKVARLAPGEEIGRRLALAPLTSGQFNALRSQYLNPKIAPAGATWAYAVLVDGKIIGAFAFQRSTYFPDEAYLLSDFAVAPSDYPRLSKLVLLAATSSEARLIMQRAMSRRLDGVSTTAFSRNQMSMKYRGLFQLVKKAATPDDPDWAWMLTYRSPLGGHTLKQGLATWRQKWGQRTPREGDAG
jgi:hypothetical protein